MRNLNQKYKRLRKEERLYGLDVPIIGLTGGIATGKSTVSNFLIKAGVPVIDADRLVKDIYALQETHEFIKQRWPDSFKNGSIHFPSLREMFFKNSETKKEIEDFIYQRMPKVFNSAYQKLGSPSFLVYDVPLLFEKGLDTKVDFKVLVYAGRDVQKTRLMQRDGISEVMVQTILNQQMNIEDKKQRADFIINNESTMENLALETEKFLRQVLID